MPPHDGEDMAPTQRLDETGDDDGVGSANLRTPHPAGPSRAPPGAALRRRMRVAHGTLPISKTSGTAQRFSDMGYEGKFALPTDQQEPTGTNNDGDLRGDDVAPCWFAPVALLHSNFIGGSDRGCRSLLISLRARRSSINCGRAQRGYKSGGELAIGGLISGLATKISDWRGPNETRSNLQNSSTRFH